MNPDREPWLGRTPAHGRTEPQSASRRDVLRGAGAAALALGVARLRWPAPAGAQEAASPAADVCVLTPELTEGPYYLPLELIRADITEGKPGLPLRLRVAVVDLANGCAPLPDAAVDLWHCDAQGYYSGVDANPGGNADPEAGAGSAAGTFLRGVQLTDADGAAEFLTVYPGWYSGRTVHIHMKVHAGGTADILDLATPAGPDAGSYEGGHVAHTGQIFFDDAVSDEVYGSVEAYAGRDDARRLRNEDDTILGDHLDEPGFLVALEPLGADPMTDGFLGTVTIGVDSTSTPEPAGFGGGPGGPGGPPPAGGPGGPPPGDEPPAGGG